MAFAQGAMSDLEQLDFAAKAYGQRIGEKITVFVEQPDLSSASKVGRKGLDGHSGIAVGEDYRDYGPQPGAGANLLGSKGRPWWDAVANPSGDASRSDIVNYIAATGKDVDVYSRWVLPSQAAEVRAYWQNLYNDPGTYHFAGQQCTTCVANSLRGAGITDFRAWKPTTLGNRLGALGW